jgi:hypothetical protein
MDSDFPSWQTFSFSCLFVSLCYPIAWSSHRDLRIEFYFTNNENKNHHLISFFKSPKCLVKNSIVLQSPKWRKMVEDFRLQDEKVSKRFISFYEMEKQFKGFSFWKLYQRLSFFVPQIKIASSLMVSVCLEN